VSTPETASVLMDDPQRAINLLRRLKDKGIPMTINDTSTGYYKLAICAPC
jgi:EAL domain-containing protein (putative c-di-GMP-specific phosphodiesterase class I)